MNPVGIDRLFRGNIQDEVGSYNGMFDFLFSAETTGTRLPHERTRNGLVLGLGPLAPHAERR